MPEFRGPLNRKQDFQSNHTSRFVLSRASASVHSISVIVYIVYVYLK